MIPNSYWIRTLKALTINLQSVDIKELGQILKSQVNSKRKTIFLHVYRWISPSIMINFSLKQVQFSLSYSFLLSTLCFQVPILSLNAFFHVIYYPLDIIFTTHVQVGFGGSLSVSSNTFWNLQLAAVRMLHHYSSITSTVMRPESWLKGN